MGFQLSTFQPSTKKGGIRMTTVMGMIGSQADIVSFDPGRTLVLTFASNISSFYTILNFLNSNLRDIKEHVLSRTVPVILPIT